MESGNKLEMDEAERRFLEDLEKAKALSLETAALDKFKQEKLRESAIVCQTSREPSPVYARVVKTVSSSRSPSVESTSPTITIKPRPRPGGSNSMSMGLVPPPIPRRQLSQSPNSNDLINLMSPVRAKSTEEEDSFLLQEFGLSKLECIFKPVQSSCCFLPQQPYACSKCASAFDQTTSNTHILSPCAPSSQAQYHEEGSHFI